MLNECFWRYNLKQRYEVAFNQHSFRVYPWATFFFSLSSPPYLCLSSFPPSPHITRKKTEALCVLHCFNLIINKIIENRVFYKKQDVKYALKYSSLFTLQSRKFCNQFINLYYRYILQAIITSKDAARADLTIPDIYQPIRIP